MKKKIIRPWQPGRLWESVVGGMLLTTLPTECRTVYKNVVAYTDVETAKRVKRVLL